jgi:riboflavin-specific deaminase-like protein
LRGVPIEPLAPEPARPLPDLLAAVRPRERAPAQRPFVYLNMIATLDGRAALDGRTDDLGSDDDLQMLLELRTLADAVLIGSGTLAAEGYDRLVRSPERRARRRAGGLAEDPLAVLISRSLDLPWDAGLFRAAEQPIVVYTGSEADAPVEVEVVRLEHPTPAAALADLRQRGVRALLSEGGPTLNHALLADGLVDELFLTLAPLITGDDDEPAIVAGGRLPDLASAELQWALRSGSELFLRYGL